MSDTPQGPGWWQASDGRWYPPEQAPGAPPATAPASGPARGPAPGPLGPGWWQASDGQWYAPEQAPGGPAAPAAAPARGPAPGPVGPGWWQASDGQWYAPEEAPVSTSGWHAAAPAVGYPTASTYPPYASPDGVWRAPTGDLLPLADWGRRAVGYLIDTGLVVGAFIALLILAAIGSAISGALGSLLLVVGYLLFSGLGIYFWILNGTKGQSPGKALIGLKVVDARTGQLIGGGMGFVRGLCHIVDSITCYLGWLWPLWDNQRQTFSDKIVHTVVLDNQPTQSFGVDIFKP